MFAIKEARNESTDLIKYFINHGAQIQEINKFGQIIWHYLGLNKNLNNEELKSVAGISMCCFNGNNMNEVDVGDVNENTALMIAIYIFIMVPIFTK